MEIHHTNHPIRLEHKNMLPYLSIPHAGELNNECLWTIFRVLEITKPQNILEIGTNRGGSALMFLLLKDDLSITTIDVVYMPKSISTLNLLFNDRFEFIQMNSAYLLNNEKFKNRYDLIFIDGPHSQANIYQDTDVALSLNPKFILYDGYLHPAHRDDFKEIIDKNPRLKKIEEFGTDCGQCLMFVMPKEN